MKPLFILFFFSSVRCIGGKRETLKFNLLNPLVVKYWDFFSGFRNKGTEAGAKRFSRRWGVTQPCPHFCEGGGAGGCSQEEEHQWWGHHPLTPHCHVGHPSAHSRQEEFHSFGPVDGHKMVLKPFCVPLSLCLVGSWLWNGSSWHGHTWIAHHPPCPDLWHSGQVK